MYLRCDRGKILWHYPHAALRVVLAIPISTSVTDLPRSPADSSGFRACVKISGPVRVFLEADGKLRQLYSPSDDKREFSYRYFHSRNDTIALYMEAEDNYSAKNARVRLQYDLEPNSLKGGVLRIPNEEEECRPCSMEELATAYCQSDLVARGTLSAVQQQLDSDTAQLVLTVTKILRQVVQETEVIRYLKYIYTDSFFFPPIFIFSFLRIQILCMRDFFELLAPNLSLNIYIIIGL